MTCLLVPRLLLICCLAAAPTLASAVEVLAGAEPAGDRPVQLTLVTLTPERIVLSDTFPGRVAAWRRVEIRPQVGGIILERPVTEGMRVAAGDVLFRIDPAPLKADLATAEAGLARAKAAEAHARRGLERSDALMAKNATSGEKNDAARNDLALAEANRAEAQAIVDRRRLDLEFATLRTPIAGHVAGGLADVGGLAAPGAERVLAVVQDLDRVHVDLRLPAASLDAIRTAAAAGLGGVEILMDGDRPHLRQGQLKTMDVIVDPGTGTVSVRVEVENPGLALLPGMYVRARLPRGVLPEALLVPEDAVLRDEAGQAQVVVVSGDGRAARRPVTLGDSIGGRVVVVSGLSAGEVIAIRGQDRVADGVPVPVAAMAADAAPASVKN
ncbi:efflux RND transporter periplasmic adaptor subunit [Rhodovulum tesquicola]|uniref:efflux RND transporter periplasmic adaptor subunit n=1 Tax=Rhodovulum tesquicola TaxID=540254 RepID=UPI002096BDBF|nr:efflux RND transporter periplasmic adaptor subunit [Rhodovulum tesquicola]MCO8146452.1 efflux RND transporter periplasmic adaptor subunit [Rhodovulum tesquicola]